MRLPKITKYVTTKEKENIEIPSLDLDRKFYNLGREKEKFKYISTIEKLCRSSLEYKDLISYLKNTMGMDFCSFFHKVSKKNFGKTRIRIEIHHEPFTLYDITAIVLNKRLEEDESVDMYDICDEVMRLHYEGCVGLLPLSTTAHELVHSGKLFIPLQFIDEGFNKFYNDYKLTIRNMDGLCDMLEAKVQLSKEFQKNPDEFLSILQKKYIYVVNENFNNIEYLKKQ